MFKKIKKNLKLIIKYICITYVVIATLVGTAVMSIPFILSGYNAFFAPAPMPIYLPNGFIYDRDREQRYRVFVVKDQNENKIIMADVKDIMVHENTIYGFRLGLAREPYYYICTYGDDCSKTQHLKEIDFIRLLKERDLPEYISRIAQTYDQLLLIQSKTDIGKKGG